MRLKNKVALITGSTKGIGRASAVLFAKEGARVAVTGRDAKAGNEVVSEISAVGGEAIFVQSDIRDEAQVKGLVERTVNHFGRLDILMNNASPTEITRGATRRDAGLADMTLADWQDVFGGSTIGFFLASKYGIPELQKAGGGSIINISSATSMRGFENAAAYPAAKGAVNSLTQSLAATYGADGIRANTIIVGLIATSNAARMMMQSPEYGPPLMERHLVKRWGEPEDVAYAALYLASDESSFVTGSMLTVDGGITCNASFPTPKSSPISGGAKA